MDLLLNLIPFLVLITMLPAIYAGYIQLSARLLRYQDITWKHSLIFGLIVVVCGLSIRAAGYLITFSVPQNRGVLIGLPVQLLAGGWYFKMRGSRRQGEPLGWRGALLLTGIAVFLFAITIVALFNFFRQH